MNCDIIIIGGGAAGLMAACGAASEKASVLVLEKMARPGRKIVITGKGRCNFTNMKDWDSFSPHVRANSNVLRPAFCNLTPGKLADFFAAHGMESVVERGDRVFPASYRSMDVVDTLAGAAESAGAHIRTDCEVSAIETEETSGKRLFSVRTTDGQIFTSTKVIIATGGLSYPATGSTGDGYRFASGLGHSVRPCFPSLTALVPLGYKIPSGIPMPQMKGHIDRSAPLSETGRLLCGNSLKNIEIELFVNGRDVQAMTGDIDFTDGGIEGPAGFSISRNAVKAIINGGKVKIILDMKPGVDENEFTSRVERMWREVADDVRSHGKPIGWLIKILLGELMPKEIIAGFLRCHPEVIDRSCSRDYLRLKELAAAIRHWEFDIAGFVGYERCVITAGGVSADEVVPKTLESRKCPGLYLCGEVLDFDADTGGYNLHIAFSTGYLAGQSAAKALQK